MLISPELFADIPDFVDDRYDAYADVMRLIHKLESDETYDSSQLINIIKGLDIDKVSNRYFDTSTKVSLGTRMLLNAIHDLKLTQFKAVIGEDDYV